MILLSRFTTLLSGNVFLRQVLVLSTGTTLAQVIAAVSSPVLTRLYSPEQFGVFTIYVSIISVLVLFGSLQYENAITLPEDDEDAASLLLLSFVILTSLCSIVGVALLAGRKELALLLHVPDFERVFWLIPFSLYGIGTYNILNRWIMRKKTFEVIARTKITQSIGMVITQIVLGLYNQGTLGLLIGDAIGRMGGSGRLTLSVLKENGKMLRNVTLSSIWEAVVRFKRFPLISSWAALLKELSDQLPAFLLVVVYGPQVVGWFMLVQRVLGLPLSLIGYSVGNVYMAEASRLVSGNGNQVLTLYWQTLKNLLYIALPFMLVITLLAPRLFLFVFGQEWQEAGIYLRILSPFYLLQFLSIPVSTTVYVLERQDLQFIREGVRFGLLLLIYFFIRVTNLQPPAAMGLVALCGSIAFVVNGLLSWIAIKENLKNLHEHG